MNHFQVKCPKCSNLGFWETGDNRLKCKNCRYVFTLKPNPFNISSEVFNEIISEFLLEHSTNIILERVNISKYKLLRILTLLRTLMAKDIPDVFKEIINPNKAQIGLAAIKQPVIGIICQEGKVYAEIVTDIEAKDLKSSFKKRLPLPENLKRYTGLTFRGYLQRVFPKDKEYQIDTLEGFWGYLKRKLSAKGGIRKEKLPLYLGEYIWRYNHRKINLKEQEKHLLNLVSQYFEPKN